MNPPVTRAGSTQTGPFILSAVLGLAFLPLLALSLWLVDAFHWTYDYLEEDRRLRNEDRPLTDGVRAYLVAQSGLDAMLVQIRRVAVRGPAPARLELSGDLGGTYASNGDRFRASAETEDDAVRIRVVAEIVLWNGTGHARHELTARARIDKETITLLEVKHEPPR
jgi:hypothetical protein